MQIEYVYIEKFKNLKKFEISLSQMKTVLIGQNATGKSNFLEALVIIFKQLDLGIDKISPDLLFEYQIIYTIGKLDKEKRIRITFKRNKGANYIHEFWLSENSYDLFGKSIFEKIKVFKKEYLPKYIFAYYSGLGNSNRLEEHFEDYKAAFARKALVEENDQVPEPPRMLYAELIHSQFSLFSFFINDDPKAKKFLEENLGIEGLKTILLTVQEPSWTNKAKKEEDPKFFGSKGAVKNLLYHIHDEVAYAPLRSIINTKGKLWDKSSKKKSEAVHLYISNFQKVREFVVSKEWSSFDFFHILNTANVSQLFNKDSIKIRVKKKYADRILFKDLSEGEQQLLTVLGLMRFTVTDESLFLLDEPDTHLNPYWRWKYMDFIDQIVFGIGQTTNDDKTNIQVVMTSHDPLTIGSLTKEEVRIFEIKKDGKIETTLPSEDPRGMGVAGILTEIFRQPTTLDLKTQVKLERRRQLESLLYNDKILTADEINELELLNNELDSLSFSRTTRDPLYQKFQATFDDRMNYIKSKLEPLTEEEMNEQNKMIEDIMKDLLKEEGL